MSPKKNAPGSKSLWTVLTNIMTEFSNSDMYIVSSLFMFHAVHLINLTHWVICTRSRFQTPIWLQNHFFRPFYIFAPSSPRHHFFASIVILFTPRRQTNERTSKQTNER
jgi:hypothetical protein